jgi:5-methylcytosine-specific restriction endonuclease McrA
MKRSPLGRRTPLRATSSRKRAQDRRRAVVRRAFMIANPDCERCGAMATDCHEIIRRSQVTDAATRPELFVALCRDCHHWATVNPWSGHAAGFVLWSWEDNPSALARARATRRSR